MKGKSNWTAQDLNSLKPTVWIGKKGFNEDIALEINHQLKTKGYIKVKILKIIRDKFDEITNQILLKTNSKVVSKKGLTITLSKKKED